MRSSRASRRRVSGIPGFTTLMTTSSPSRVVARWICAIEAEPSGSGSIQKQLVDRPAEIALDQLAELVERNRRQAVEQVLELVGDRLGQQVFAQAQDLAQLDVGRPEQLEAPPELDGERQVGEVAP